MRAALQHASSLETAPESYIFKNDANNITALQIGRRQKKLLEEAARLQQQKLDNAAEELRLEVEDKEKVREDRDKLHEKVAILTKAVQQNEAKLQESEARLNNLAEQKKGELEEQAKILQRELEDKAKVEKDRDELQKAKSGLETSMQVKETERSEIQAQLATMSTKHNKRVAEIEELNQTITVIERKLPGKWQENCLPIQYDGATVMIVNLQSQMALDAGKWTDKWTAHAWQFNHTNEYQVFTLTRVDGDHWNIKRKYDGQYLYYPNGNTDVDVHVGTSISGKQANWLIGRGSSSRVGSWVIKNAEWGTYIELENTGRENGVRTKSYPFSDRFDANWIIIPFSFSS